jgi:hypothetical protein
MNQLRSRTTALLLPAMTVLVLGLWPSTLAAAQKSAPSKDEADRYTYVPFAGQSVAIDCQTGKLRPPTPTEARQLAASLKNFLNRSDQGLTIRTRQERAPTAFNQ